MKIYLTTDTHFGHAKLTEWGRPEKFEDLILKGLGVVKAGDTIIHLGDFCIGQDEYWHKIWNDKLVGVRKILIKGNHDNKSNNWYYNHGWDFVCEEFVDTQFGKQVLFSHTPKSVGWLNIHGHTHGNLHRSNEYKDFYGENHIELALENNDYKVWSLEKLIK